MTAPEGAGSQAPQPPMDYRAAGVDIEAADAAKARMRALVESTFTPLVRGGFGGFGGLFHVPPGAEGSLLVASADGVGTKVKLAIEAGRHNTIGHDLVNHCVNDILAQGASPLFFLDYLAFGRLEPDIAAAVVAGVAAGCKENGCALIGGETAEMPGIYTYPDYDLAGFIVGIVDEAHLLGPSRVRPDDGVIALASSGLHTNGYSLARRIVAERLHLSVYDRFPGMQDSVADVLLRVHRSYLSAVRPVLGDIHAMAHITGGGLPGNVPRALPATVNAVLNRSSWAPAPEFAVLADAGGISSEEMFRAFNMGVGMVVICAPAAVGRVLDSARAASVDAWQLGEIVRGEGRVILN
jgi:phosphoribosylformylglycinamidine cyclo-ligase